MIKKFLKSSSLVRYLYIILFGLIVTIPIVYSSIYPSGLNLTFGLVIVVSFLVYFSYAMGFYDDIDIRLFKETRYNSSFDDCVREINNLLLKADYEVRIITGGLNEKVWG